MSVVANVAINVDATKAVQQLKAVDSAAKNIQGGLDGASKGAGGLGSALTAALGPLVTFTAAVELFRRSVEAAFQRSQAETRLKALSAAYGETAHVTAMATSASDKFGLTQTEASKAIGDVYGRLRPLGFGLKEVNGVYEGFNILSKQAALSSDEASSVFTQLAQSLGSGALRGDEFNRMAESMPGILGAVAKELGVSQTQLKGMASEGKLSSEVVVRALQSVAKAGGDLDQFLDPSTKAMNSLKKSSEDLLVEYGKLFGPVVVGAINIAAEVFNKMAEGYEYFGGVILPKIQKILQPLLIELQKLFAGFDPSILIKLWQGGMIIVLEEVVRILKLIVPIITSVVEAFRVLGENPVFQTIGQSIQGATGFLIEAYNKIVAYKDAQSQIVKEKMKEVELSSGMPAKIDAATVANNAKLQSYIQTQKVVVAEQNAIERQVAALDRGASITAARYEAEKALNDLKVQELEREYQFAATAEQRLVIISEILKKELEGAKLEYQQKLENIELEKQKLDLKIKQAEIEYKSLEVVGQRQILEAKNVEEEKKKKEQMDQALSKQKEVISATKELGTANQEIGKYQKQTAEAQLKSKELAIQQKFEQSAVKDEVGLTREQAKQLSDGIINNINNTDQLQSSWQNVRLEIEAAARAASFARQEAANSGSSSSGGGGGPKGAAKGAYWQGGFQAFKKGGMVNRPTLGLIGEGGEPEYIIPASKMGSASANYLSGARGSAVIPASSGGGDVGGSSRNGASPQISIQTGPVTQMNGTNYVTTKQLAIAVQAGVSQTLAMISGDINTRASLGMA